MWFSCPECRDETVFDQPPCGDGHGVDCPEWFCVTCGYAVFLGGSQVALVAVGAGAAGGSRKPGTRRERAVRPHAA